MINLNLHKQVIRGTQLYNETLSVEFRCEPEDITLREHVDLVLYVKQLPEWFMSTQDGRLSQEEVGELVATWDFTRWREYYGILAEIVARHTNVSVEDIYNLPAIDKDNADGVFNSIQALYGMLMNAHFSYVPQVIDSFEYEGDTYILPASDPLLGGEPLPGSNLRVIEAMEAMQVEQIYSTLDPETGEFMVADAAYHIHVGIIAATCRKLVNGEPETIPVQGNSWDIFFQQRCQHLEGINMATARDVFFFIQTSRKQYKRTLSSAWLSLLPPLKSS